MKSMDATIIVVEDEPGVRATLCGILMENTSYKVIGLENGADALQMIRKNHFDVIIADIRLPDISGLEILEIAKEINPEAAVIMMTGYASVETAVDAVNQGAYAYFVKPVNPDEIKTAIANALKQQRLSLENKRLVESLQRSNELLLEINEELRNEIAERKRVEENLREAKKFSNGLITWMGDGFSILDSNGVHIDVNAAFCKMTGFPREELIGVGPPHPYWPPEAYEELDSAVQKTLRGEFGSSELTFMRKNGERFPVIVTPSWMRDEGGNIISYFATVKDITERKKGEQLQHDENYVLTLLGQGAELSKLLDAIVRLGEYNDPSIKGSVLLFDHSRECLVQASAPSLPDNFTELLKDGLPIGPNAGSCGTAAYLKERVIVTDIENSPLFKPFEEAVKRAIGNGLLACWSQPIISSNGDLLGTIANYSNKVGEPNADSLMVLEWSARIAAIAIERKRTEEALRESEEKYRSLTNDVLNSSAVGLFILDRDFKIVWVNRALERYLGLRSDEVIGKDKRDLIRNRIKNIFKDPEAFAQRVLATYDNNTYIENFECHVLPDGEREERWLEHWSQPIYSGLYAGGRIEHYTDITERKRMEEALKESEKKFHNLVESAPIGIGITSPDGHLIEANKALVQMHRYDSKEEFMKMPTSTRYYDPADREHFMSLVAKGPIKDFETRRKRYDGTIFWASLSTIPQTTESGEQVLITVVQDITERKQAEEALKESEAIHRALIDLGAQVGEAVVMLQDEGSKEAVHVFCSDAWLQITGYSREELRKMSFGELERPKDREASLVRHRRRMSGESTPGLFELTIIRKDGTEVPLELTSAYSTYQGKRVDVVYARDITRRKQVLEALRQSEEKLRLMFEALPDGITVIDTDRKIAQINKAAARIHGYDNKEEMVGLDIFEFVAEQEHARVKEVMKKTLKEGYLGAHEFIDLRKDRSEFPAEVSAAVLKDAPGNPIGFITITKDITERKQMEEALRQSEEKLRLMFEALPDGITVLDTDGKIVQINKAAAHIHGYDNKEEMIGLDIFEFVAKKEHTRVKEIIKKTRKEGYLGANEIIDSRKDRSEFPAEVSGTVLKDASGNPTGFITITKDITERKQMENELREGNERLQLQAEELKAQQQELMEKTREVEEATRLKSEFLAHMSHELRTPLNAIIGFSELMLDKVPGEINEEQRQCLDDILSSGKHLLNLINDVLDLSKIESGKAELKMGDIALPEVIESVARTMMPTLTSRKQSLEIEIEEGIPPVYADKAKLGQVFLNLVDNSSKFTPNGGRLKIEAIREDNWCQVSVVDNGVGIKKEDQRKLFEPFSQLDNSLRKEKGGTGLGLALVKQIVERYGGRIWVQSRYGRGSRFTFTLPLAKAN